MSTIHTSAFYHTAVSNSQTLLVGKKQIVDVTRGYVVGLIKL